MKRDAIARTRSAGLVAGVVAALTRPGIKAGILRLEDADSHTADALTDDIMAVGEALHFQIEPFELRASLFDDPEGPLMVMLGTVCARSDPLLFVLTDSEGTAGDDALVRLLLAVRRTRDEGAITGVLLLTRRSIGDAVRVLDRALSGSRLPYESAVIS